MRGKTPDCERSSVASPGPRTTQGSNLVYLSYIQATSIERRAPCRGACEGAASDRRGCCSSSSGAGLDEAEKSRAREQVAPGDDPVDESVAAAGTALGNLQCVSPHRQHAGQALVGRRGFYGIRRRSAGRQARWSAGLRARDHGRAPPIAHLSSVVESSSTRHLGQTLGMRFTSRASLQRRFDRRDLRYERFRRTGGGRGTCGAAFQGNRIRARQRHDSL